MPVNPVSSNPAAVPAAQTQTSAPSVISSDFETFLVMLTAQMNNQDPLNPLDSQDFATQLATFSGVEQQVKTNDLLTSLGQQMGLSGLADMAGWVGMDARVTGPVQFDGSSVELFPSMPAFADTAQLVVTDRSGAEVQRLSIPVGDDPITWSGGTGPDGTPIGSGLYQFSVEAFSNGDVINTAAPEHFARVTEVRSTASGVVVVLDGDLVQPATAVSGLRQAA